MPDVGPVHAAASDEHPRGLSRPGARAGGDAELLWARQRTRPAEAEASVVAGPEMGSTAALTDSGTAVSYGGRVPSREPQQPG